MFSALRPMKKYANKNCEGKHWMTFCEGCIGLQPVQSNALQEAVAQNQPELQIYNISHYWKYR